MRQKNVFAVLIDTLRFVVGFSDIDVSIERGIIRFRTRITRRNGHWPKFWRRISRLLRVELREECIPPPRRYDVEDRSNERRRALIRLFEYAGVAWRGDRNVTVLWRAFLELPFDRQLNWDFENFYEAVSQTVRFRWQIPHNELLLADRVVDLLVGLFRMRKDAAAYFPFEEIPGVRLDYQPQLDRERKFPWVVVVETDTPGLMRKVLEPFADWIEIGVDLAPARQRHANACRVGPGMAGVLGGVMAGERDRFFATCAHVLADGCGAAVCRGTPRANRDEPDAALVEYQQGCFERWPTEPCMAASTDAIERCITSKHAVWKLHPRRRACRGVIRSRVLAYTINGALCRFPHLEIVSWPAGWQRIFRWLTPPFSRPGDSGSWVFAETPMPEEDGDWAGMVVGADEENPASFAAEAQPLVDFFETATQRRHGRFQPHQFNQ